MNYLSLIDGAILAGMMLFSGIIAGCLIKLKREVTR